MASNRDDVFLGLEAKLVDDVDGVVKRELQNYLEEWRWRVKQAIDRGLPPEEFVQFQRIEGAIARAAEVIGRAWSLAHPTAS